MLKLLRDVSLPKKLSSAAPFHCVRPVRYIPFWQNDSSVERGGSKEKGDKKEMRIWAGECAYELKMTLESVGSLTPKVWMRVMLGS